MTSRIAYLAAPALVLAYGVIRIIDGLDGSRGPGLAWTTGHLAFLLALGFFGQILWDMRSRLRTRTATVLAATGSLGVLALGAQFTVDIVVGLLATDRMDMHRMMEQVLSVPVLSPVIYDFGPYFFYLSQIALVLHLAVSRQVGYLTPLLVLVDMVLPQIDKDLIPIGAIILFISFLPLARTANRPRPALA